MPVLDDFTKISVFLYLSVLGCLTLTRRNDRRPGKCCFTTLQELFPFPKKWVYKTSESLIKTWHEQLNCARGTLVQIPLFPLSLFFSFICELILELDNRTCLMIMRAISFISAFITYGTTHIHVCLL